MSKKFEVKVYYGDVVCTIDDLPNIRDAVVAGLHKFDELIHVLKGGEPHMTVWDYTGSTASYVYYGIRIYKNEPVIVYVQDNLNEQ